MSWGPRCQPCLVETCIFHGVSCHPVDGIAHHKYYQGLIPGNQWNVHSRSRQNKNQSTNTFQPKSNNVIKLRDRSLTINQNPKGWTDWKREKKKKQKKTREKHILLKSCGEMAMTKSETDIPQNDNTVMNANFDKKLIETNTEDEESCRYGEMDVGKGVRLDKKNSLDGTSEEMESSESEEAHYGGIEKKVPSTVQEWVNHLPFKDVSRESDLKESTLSSESKPSGRAELSREASLQSTSSLDSILDSRRPDPVEIFLNLGFGGLPGVDTENCRIPKRFLVPSKCKGGDWDEFLRRELLQAQNFECSSLGFRGLSGPSYRRPSAIVANIMEKLRERTVPPQHNRSRFSTVAKMVLNEKSVLKKLTPEFQSVLSPDSRKFLQNQGKKSPEVPRRRIIFGQKSFAFAHDGEFVEVESSNIEGKTTKDPPTSSNDGEEVKAYPSPEVLLKLRRSSLQKQKKVEEDSDVDDVFYVVGKDSTDPTYSNNNNNNNDNNSTSNNNNNNNNNNNDNINNNNNNNNSGSDDCCKKAGKIPRRFLSSSNLKALEENNLSEAMRLEVEKEILSLSQRVKSISNQDLPSVLQQVKELRSKIENGGQDSTNM